MEVEEKKYPSGNLNEKYEIRKTDTGIVIKDGKYTKFHENGQKECEGEYIDNIKFGHWTYWYESGEIQEEGEYFNDERSKNWKVYPLSKSEIFEENQLNTNLTELQNSHNFYKQSSDYFETNTNDNFNKQSSLKLIKSNSKVIFISILGGLIIVLVLFYFFIFKNDNTDETNLTSNELKKKELDIKERELILREKELNSDSHAENEKIKNISEINLTGSYAGTIKDGTRWFVDISSFNGKNFTGYNVIYWKSTPSGFRTSFTGTFNSSSNEILMYEDKNAKGAGKFIGKVSKDGNSLSGNWFRYTDNGSFTWNLRRNE